MTDRIATIYDYSRFMRDYCVNTRCESCQLSIHNNETDTPCRGFVCNYPEKVNEIILKWCDEHPQRTYNANSSEEAEYAKEILSSGFYIGGTDTEKCVKISLEALEKQIPKKPFMDNDNGVYCIECCPTCHRSLFPYDHHCICGQAIDWSDAE